MRKTVNGIKEPLYCLTGRNRLTGEREIISSRMTKRAAEEAKKYLRGNRRKPYTYCKVELYVAQPDLFNH